MATNFAVSLTLSPPTSLRVLCSLIRLKPNYIHDHVRCTHVSIYVCEKYCLCSEVNSHFREGGELDMLILELWQQSETR